jgi:hypothetical protein
MVVKVLLSCLQATSDPTLDAHDVDQGGSLRGPL